LSGRIFNRKDYLMMQKTGKAVGYIRVSTQEQAKDGVSLDRQESQIRAYCQLKGITDLEIIADKGVSGFKPNRVGYQSLISLCQSKKVSTVIVYDLSRLSRSVRGTLAFMEDVIKKHDVEFVSLKENIDTSTPMGTAFYTMLCVWNQFLRDEISYKTKNALKHKRANKEKTGGVIPFGYSLVGSKRLIPKPEELTTVRYIHELRSKGFSLREIVADLQANGIKTKQGFEKWQPKVISQILNRHIDEIVLDPDVVDADRDNDLTELCTALRFTNKIIKTESDRKVSQV
jgi:DNA invertase Pin-like site-specific DNA recombinase